MKISLIIPTLNASDIIKQLLENLTSQVCRPHETIVVDSSSSDGTSSLAESMGARTIVVPKEDFDHGGTRTLAAKAANGEILVYLTQDALPVDEHSIENLVRPLIEDEKVGAVFGRQLPYPDASAFGSHLRLFNYPERSYKRSLADKDRHGIKTAFLSNSFAAYRRSVLEEVGWFKENLIMCEDTYAGARMLVAGYQIAYAADSMVYHSHNYTISHEFKRYFDIGVFYKAEGWIIREFGRPEGEGMRYINSGLAYLANHRKYHLIPEFFLRSVLKYIGYMAGQNFESLPRRFVSVLSMHHNWWDRQA